MLYAHSSLRMAFPTRGILDPPGIHLSAMTGYLKTHGDGKTERLLVVASADAMKNFNHLFSVWWRGNIFDSHMCLSIWHRPRQSNFTRAQRLTVYVTALFMTMIANAMWYREDTVEDPSVLTITLGPFIITYYQIYASVASCLLVLPVIFTLKQVFVYTDSTTKTLHEAMSDYRNFTRRNMMNRSTQFEEVNTSRRDEEDYDNDDDNAEYVWKKNKRNRFPYVCIYLGWTLCFISCTLAGFFTILYSLYWGGDKAKRWLGALFLSVMEDMFLLSTGQVSYLIRSLSLISSPTGLLNISSVQENFILVVKNLNDAAASTIRHEVSRCCIRVSLLPLSYLFNRFSCWQLSLPPCPGFPMRAQVTQKSQSLKTL